jgi:hypothetical protein
MLVTCTPRVTDCAATPRKGGGRTRLLMGLGCRRVMCTDDRSVDVTDAPGAPAVSRAPAVAWAVRTMWLNEPREHSQKDRLWSSYMLHA